MARKNKADHGTYILEKFTESLEKRYDEWPEGADKPCTLMTAGVETFDALLDNESLANELSEKGFDTRDKRLSYMIDVICAHQESIGKTEDGKRKYGGPFEDAEALKAALAAECEYKPAPPPKADDPVYADDPDDGDEEEAAAEDKSRTGKKDTDRQRQAEGAESESRQRSSGGGTVPSTNASGIAANLDRLFADGLISDDEYKRGKLVNEVVLMSQVMKSSVHSITDAYNYVSSSTTGTFGAFVAARRFAKARQRYDSVSAGATNMLSTFMHELEVRAGGPVAETSVLSGIREKTSKGRNPISPANNSRGTAAAATAKAVGGKIIKAGGAAVTVGAAVGKGLFKSIHPLLWVKGTVRNIQSELKAAIKDNKDPANAPTREQNIAQYESQVSPEPPEGDGKSAKFEEFRKPIEAEVSMVSRTAEAAVGREFDGGPDAAGNLRAVPAVDDIGTDPDAADAITEPAPESEKTAGPDFDDDPNVNGDLPEAPDAADAVTKPIPEPEKAAEQDFEDGPDADGDLPEAPAADGNDAAAGTTEENIEAVPESDDTDDDEKNAADILEELYGTTNENVKKAAPEAYGGIDHDAIINDMNERQAAAGELFAPSEPDTDKPIAKKLNSIKALHRAMPGENEDGADKDMEIG